MKKSLSIELLVGAGLAVILAVVAFRTINQGKKQEVIRREAIVSSQGKQNVKEEKITSVPQASASKDFSLRIGTPYNGQVVKTATVKVSGITAPGAQVAINDKDLRADTEGNFSYDLILDPGDNVIDILANDSAGNWAEKEINVTYEL